MDERATWVVPGYVAEELIGFGATGEVWRGRATDTAETVALKRLRAGATDHARRRLEREAALLATIDHPHLLRVRELVSTGEETVLVLDHAAGGSLATLLRRRGRLRPGEVVTVLAPVAAALAYAHDQGLVHGDVSAANVLFTAEGRPMLADLGVARALGERDEPSCTPDYLDPAVAAGAVPGPASDVFMVAAVAVHALTGAPPWRADSPQQATALAAAGRVPELSGLLPDGPESLTRAVQRALSASPAERGTATDLALDMGHACRPEPVRLCGPSSLLPAPTMSDGAAAVTALTHAVPTPEPADAAGAPAAAGGSPRHRRDDRRRPRLPSAGGPPGSAPAVLRPGRRTRSIRRGVVAGIALIAAALVGVAWGSAGSTERPVSLATAGAPSGPPTRADADPAGSSRIEPDQRRWLQVLAALDGVRAQAYERGDTRLLTRVYLPGRHLQADSAQLAALVSAGDTARGVRHQMTRLDVLAASKDRVRLRVTQSLRQSQQIHGGHVVGVIPGTTETAVLVDLVATAAGWRLA
jgi:eukaryotic-like serine/threonine-protein kinase